jgi:hypothetical protein
MYHFIFLDRFKPGVGKTKESPVVLFPLLVLHSPFLLDLHLLDLHLLDLHLLDLHLLDLHLLDLHIILPVIGFYFASQLFLALP